MPKDLRSFLREVIAARPGEIKHVSDTVDPRFGATGRGPAIRPRPAVPGALFRKDWVQRDPARPEPHGHLRPACARAGHDVANLVPTFGELMTRPLPAREVARHDAPVKEQVWTGDEVDLGKLPLLTHNELDGGPYITSGIGIMRDPETGRINAGIYRHQVYSRNELGVWFIDTHHGAYIHRSYEQRGQPAPIAIAIGHHPAFVMGAVCRIPGHGRRVRGGRRTSRGGRGDHAGRNVRPAGAGPRGNRARRRGHPSRAQARRSVRRMAGPLHG